MTASIAYRTARQPRRRGRVESMRLDSMLRCSRLAVFGALFPTLPSHPGSSQAATTV